MPDEHEEHVFLIVKQGCPVCEEAERELKDLIDEHKIELVDISDSRFNEIKSKLDINKVPTCVIAVKNGNEVNYDYCSETEKAKQSD